jgi:hypothetical protein
VHLDHVDLGAFAPSSASWSRRASSPIAVARARKAWTALPELLGVVLA